MRITDGKGTVQGYFRGGPPNVDEIIELQTDYQTVQAKVLSVQPHKNKKYHVLTVQIIQ